MRRPVLATLLVALVLPLGACGDRTESYCSELESRRKEIAEMIGSDSPSALLDALPMLRKLAEKAPDDLADQWQTYVSALTGLDDALEDAGVKASDFDAGKPPAGLSATERQAIADAVTQISSDDVVAASGGIEQQARDVCKVNLGL